MNDTLSATSPLFDAYGNFLGQLPEECWQDCSTPGQDASEAVTYWRKKLNFAVPREQAIEWLTDTGAWPRVSEDDDKGLVDMSDDELADKVLWLASCEIREQGEWFGLVN